MYSREQMLHFAEAYVDGLILSSGMQRVVACSPLVLG